jgi:hypothetical protein
MPPHDDQPWDGTERRSGIDRRRKDRWTLEGDQPAISDRRAPRPSGEASPPATGAIDYCRMQLRRIRGRLS